MNFWRATEILGKRKWLIILSVVVAAVLTAGATRLVGSRWVGTVRLVVPQNSSLIRTNASGEEASGEGMAAMEAIKNQIAVFTAVARSRDVVEPVLESLGFTELPKNFLKNIEITAASPRLFELAVSDSTPARAKALANAISKRFVDKYQRLNTEQADIGIKILKEQMQSANAKLISVRKRYDQYRGDHQIAGTVANNLELALSRLKDNRHQVDETTQRLAEAKAQLATLRSQPVPKTAVAAADAPVNGAAVLLQKDLKAAELRVATLRLKYTDAVPEMKAAKQHLEDVKAQLVAATSAAPGKTAAQAPSTTSPETIRLMHRLELEEAISGYEAKVSALNVAIVAAQNEVDKLKGIDGSISALTNEIAEQTELRNGLAGRLDRAQTQLDAARSQAPITIMDPVNDFNPPINTTQGRTLKLTFLGALCALLLTTALVLSLDSVDRRLKTVTEAEFVLPVSVVAAIPQPMGRVTYQLMARATELEPQSLHAEAFRFLGRHVLNQPANIRSIMILAAKAEQGSTTALVNLGITLAQAGKRVILVDANIRTPELHHAFGLDNDFGFTNLVGQPHSGAIDTALRGTSVQNLRVLTSGTRPDNPWELFRSPGLIELSEELHKQADYVLYDTPSALMFTDALNLAPVVDGAYICIRALQPLTGSEERIIDLVKAGNVMLLGGILTDVPASVIAGYQNYQSYYASGVSEGSSIADSQIEPLHTPDRVPMAIVPHKGED